MDQTKESEVVQGPSGEHDYEERCALGDEEASSTAVGSGPTSSVSGTASTEGDSTSISNNSSIGNLSFQKSSSTSSYAATPGSHTESGVFETEKNVEGTKPATASTIAREAQGNTPPQMNASDAAAAHSGGGGVARQQRQGPVGSVGSSQIARKDSSNASVASAPAGDHGSRLRGQKGKQAAQVHSDGLASVGGGGSGNGTRSRKRPGDRGQGLAPQHGFQSVQGVNAVTLGSINLPVRGSQEQQHDIVEQSPQGRYVRFHEKLGSGAYKDVYRAYDTIEGIEVAWNQVKLSGIPKSDKIRIINEVRLLERLQHPNIISFHGSWVNRELEQVVFVTEILSSGTLKSFINKVQVIRWRIAKRWAVQILKGLEYLHSQDPPIIHRDLKCENIFINGTTGDLRIGDLGLSTVISSRSKVLSVLGTPEFMAPELYDESYDEKVDIYAFGMCLLEIFTKEVPYSECSNPAQIYKKVTNGVPPASLRRIHSQEAREFIMYCVGTGPDENGFYMRPSAAELLHHPFLEKREDDEVEVVVEPDPEVHHEFEEGSYEEYESESLDSVNVPGISASVSTPMPAPQHRTRQPSMDGSSHDGDDDDDSDHFSGLPESEANMKKVKVFMGRGQEIEEDEEVNGESHVRPVVTSDDQLNPLPVPTGVTMERSDGSSGSSDRSGAQADASLQQSSSQVVQESVESSSPRDPRYPVAAKPMEGADYIGTDVMKLIITLPVEGKPQNVQFDFHLVEDDPIQVAKEMVSELHIPENAVLEISSTISGLARAARMKKESYYQRLRQQKPPKNQAQIGEVSQTNAQHEPHSQQYAAEHQNPHSQHYAAEHQNPHSQQYAAEHQNPHSQQYAAELQNLHPQQYTAEHQNPTLDRPSLPVQPTNHHQHVMLPQQKDSISTYQQNSVPSHQQNTGPAFQNQIQQPIAQTNLSHPRQDVVQAGHVDNHGSHMQQSLIGQQQREILQAGDVMQPHQQHQQPAPNQQREVVRKPLAGGQQQRSVSPQQQPHHMVSQKQRKGILQNQQGGIQQQVRPQYQKQQQKQPPQQQQHVQPHRQRQPQQQQQQQPRQQRLPQQKQVLGQPKLGSSGQQLQQMQQIASQPQQQQLQGVSQHHYQKKQAILQQQYQQNQGVSHQQQQQMQGVGHQRKQKYTRQQQSQHQLVSQQHKQAQQSHPHQLQQSQQPKQLQQPQQHQQQLPPQQHHQQQQVLLQQQQHNQQQKHSLNQQRQQPQVQLQLNQQAGQQRGIPSQQQPVTQSTAPKMQQQSVLMAKTHPQLHAKNSEHDNGSGMMRQNWTPQQNQAPGNENSMDDSRVGTRINGPGGGNPIPPLGPNSKILGEDPSIGGQPVDAVSTGPRNLDVPADTNTALQPRLQKRGSGIESVSTQDGSLYERGSTFDEDSSDGECEESREELRRMEEEYQRNLLRAKKAYETRMGHLQRSLHEREAQHQRTLERHEKDLADFEKRVKLAEAEQQKRLIELQAQWEKQRAGISLKKKEGGKEEGATASQQAYAGVDDSQNRMTSQEGNLPAPGSSA